MTDSKLIQVFVSCPGDVIKEKEIIKKVCESVNHSLSIRGIGIFFEVLDFKDIVASWGNRPQEDINKRFSGYDIYIGLLWMRYGTASGGTNPVTGKLYESGTEEEFHIAVSKFKAGLSVKIYFFFKDPAAPADIRETESLLKVQKFKKEIEPTGWVNSFPNNEDMTDFNIKIQKVIWDWVFDIQKIIRAENKDEFAEEIKLSSSSENVISVSSFIKGIQPYKKILHRTLSPFELKTDSMDLFFGKVNGERLSDLVEKQSRIVLLGSAGSGKSTELSNLAATYSENDSLFIPVFQRMNTYVNENIEDYLPKDWNKIPENICLVILDGLDEVEPANFHTAVRKISSFSTKFPQVHIVVSCRTNFYDFPSGVSGGTLSDFNVYLFDDIDIKSIQSYATEAFKITGEAFVKEAYNKEYKDLITQPFFLKLLLEKYQESGNLGVSKVKLLEEFVEQRFDFDQQHFKETTNLKDKKTHVMMLLKKVALTMEYMGKNYVTMDELREVLPNPNDLELIRFSTTFKNYESDPNLWGFEHNNIQEFLAASVLRDMKVDRIKDTISFNRKLIKPSWVNTLFFLMSIIGTEERDQLIEWMLNVDPEILVKIEAEKINPKIRLKIFKNIFNSYKVKDVWLRSNKFTAMELARFAPMEHANHFLLKELLDKNNTRFTRLNALHIIEDQQLGSEENISTKEALLSFIFDKTIDVYAFNATAYAIAGLGYADSDLIDKLMEIYGERKNQYIRSGIYKLIKQAKLESRYVDYLIDGLIIVDKDPDRQETTLLDESIHLTETLSADFEVDALKKIIKLFADVNKRVGFRLNDRYKVFKKIIERSVDLYGQHPELYDLVYQTYKNYVRIGDEKMLQIMTNFFVMTKTNLEVFKEIFINSEAGPYQKALLYKRLVDREAIDFVIGQYKLRNLTNKDLQSFYDEAKWFGGQQVENEIPYLEEQIRANSDLLNDRAVVDMQALRLQYEQKNVEVLFSMEQFKQEIIQFFERHQIVELNWDLLYSHKSYDYTDETQILEAPFDFLSELTAGQHVFTLDQVLAKTLNAERFQDYLFEKLKDKLAGNSEIVLTDIQKEQLEAWVRNRVSNADIANAIIVNKSDRTRTSFKTQAEVLWYYISKFDIVIDREKILDFTTYDDLTRNADVSLDFSVIEKQVGKDAVGFRVISNLENGIDYDDAWRNNAIYALENELELARPFILSALSEGILSYHTKQEVLKVYDKQVKDSNDLVSLLDVIGNDSIRWTIFNLILAKNSHKNEIIKQLIALIDSDVEPQQEKYLAAQQLTRLGSHKGIVYYLDYLIKNSNDDGGSYIDAYYDAAYLKNISDPVYLPKLMELLKISKTRRENDEFDRLETYVTEVLLNIGKSSENNLIKVKTAIQSFIIENLGKIEHVNFFYPFIESMEHQFYLSQSQDVDVKTALNEVAKILI